MPDLPKVGDRIRLIEMPHDPCPIEPGTTGTVTHVDVFTESMPASRSRWVDGRAVETQLPAPDATGQIGVKWDNGRTLNLALPVDTFEIIEENSMFKRGDAVIIHYPDHDVPAIVNHVGEGEEAGSYHLVTNHSAVWAEPEGPVITFEHTENTEEHNKIRPICDLPPQEA